VEKCSKWFVPNYVYEGEWVGEDVKGYLCCAFWVWFSNNNNNYYYFESTGL
jgi:hypothetical protein